MSKKRFSPRWRELSKFVVAGVFNTLAALSIYWGMLSFGATIWAASAISMILGIAVSFQSHRRYVFGARAKFARYVCVWLSIYVMNLAGLYLLTPYISAYAAAIVLLPINVAASYFLLRIFVFNSYENNERHSARP